MVKSVLTIQLEERSGLFMANIFMRASLRNIFLLYKSSDLQITGENMFRALDQLRKPPA